MRRTSAPLRVFYIHNSVTVPNKPVSDQSHVLLGYLQFMEPMTHCARIYLMRCGELKDFGWELVSKVHVG